MNKIAIVCSEFNKELVEVLYSQACKQFEEYKNLVKNILSKDFIANDLSLESLRENKSSDFIKGKSNLIQLIENRPDQSVNQAIKSFLSGIVNLDTESFWTPGAGEIPLAVQWLMENKRAQAVLALGVIVRGQTGHYDFLCRFLEKSLWDLQKTYSAPLIFSVLMAENRQQAEERIKRGRGAEDMKSLIQMLQLNNQIKNYANHV